MERLTNQQAKEAAIREAYGDKWEEAKRFVNPDGWINRYMVSFITEIDTEGFDSDGNWRRPVSLRGIESNAGWERIQPDGSNLPDKQGTYLWYRFNGSIHELYYLPETDFVEADLFEKQKAAFTSGEFTHYRPKEVLPKPIF